MVRKVSVLELSMRILQNRSVSASKDCLEKTLIQTAFIQMPLIVTITTLITRAMCNPWRRLLAFNFPGLRHAQLMPQWRRASRRRLRGASDVRRRRRGRRTRSDAFRATATEDAPMPCPVLVCFGWAHLAPGTVIILSTRHWHMDNNQNSVSRFRKIPTLHRIRLWLNEGNRTHESIQ